MGASTRLSPVLTDLYSRRTRLAPHAPPSPSSSRAGSAYGIRPASNHPGSFYTGAKSQGGVWGAFALRGGGGFIGWEGGGAPEKLSHSACMVRARFNVFGMFTQLLTG